MIKLICYDNYLWTNRVHAISLLHEARMNCVVVHESRVTARISLRVCLERRNFKSCTYSIEISSISHKKHRTWKNYRIPTFLAANFHYSSKIWNEIRCIIPPNRIGGRPIFSHPDESCHAQATSRPDAVSVIQNHCACHMHEKTKF